MKAEEELLEKWEKEIDKRWIKNKLKFLWYGFWGNFKEIRDIINCCEKRKPRRNKIEAFIGICDSRIDRLKSFSRDLMTFISVSADSFAITVSIIFGSDVIKIETEGKSFPLIQWFFNPEVDWLAFKILIAVLLIVIVLLTLLVWRYRAQANAWYAIKEGVLLMKKNK